MHSRELISTQRHSEALGGAYKHSEELVSTRKHLEVLGSARKNCTRKPWRLDRTRKHSKELESNRKNSEVLRSAQRTHKHSEELVSTRKHLEALGRIRQLVSQSNIIGYWIGLTCNETNGAGTNAVCTWLDGTPYNYQNWQAGVPDGASGSSGCANNNCLVTMYYSGTWDDHGDFEPFGIACQTQCPPPTTTTTPAPTTTTPAPTTTTATCTTCPPGYTAFENACYLITGNSSSFAGAQNYCQANGGGLVSIHDNA
uniref:C-type lectin domain-containing protein n=1 Tax=Acrobeloides nanus TaxID=290746 RepID=A0A914CJE9_9BILA